MLWPEVRKAYPNQWLIIEALEARTMPDNRRWLGRLAVIESCPDGKAALQRYRHLHHEYPTREFYFVHTSREELDILERQWLGIRNPPPTLVLPGTNTVTFPHPFAVSLSNLERSHFDKLSANGGSQ